MARGVSMTNLVRRNVGTRVMALLLTVLLVLSGCPVEAKTRSPGSLPSPSPSPTRPSASTALPPPSSLPPPPLPDSGVIALPPPVLPPAPASASVDESDPEGPDFTLTAGADNAGKSPQVKTLTLRPISREQYDRLVARLEPLKSNSEDSFKLPTESLQPLPARPGNVKALSFPPAALSQEAPKAPSKTASPLRITRFTPEGKVSEVTTVSITFSQPMVPVTSADRAAETVPAQISPQPEGQWRWLGTQTLVFEPKGKKFPRSTEFKVIVPKDTVSEQGGKLAAEVSFKFQTPLVEIYNFEPQGNDIELQPQIVATFTQKIDVSKVFKNMSLTSGKSTFQLKLVPKEEALKVGRFKDIERNYPNAWLVAKPVSSLPKNTQFKVVFMAGLPSAEGPLTMPKSLSYLFHTYGPLTIDRNSTETNYEYWTEPSIHFSNSLEKTQLSQKVSISPDVRDFAVDNSSQGMPLILRGRFKHGTTYKVTFAPSVKDVFGQNLSGNPVVVFRTAVPSPSISQDEFAVLEPAANLKFPIRTTGIKRFKLSVYKVTPSECVDVFKDSQNLAKKLSSRRVWSGVVPVAAAPDGDEDVTQFGISKYLPNGHGILVLDSYSDEADQRQTSVVQVSDLGLEGISDSNNVVTRVFSFKTGIPLKDIDLGFDSGGIHVKSDVNGLVKLPTPDKTAYIIIAKRGDESAILPKNMYETGWSSSKSYNNVCWFAQTDRELYRPGETVHIKGWLRERNEGENSTLKLIQVPNAKVQLIVWDPTNNKLMDATKPIDKLGGFDFETSIPKNVNLGNAHMEFTLLDEHDVAPGGYDEGRGYSAEFKIQEFRRPEFELSVEEDQAAPYFDGDQFSFTAEAKYFAGGALAGAPLNWEVTTNSSQYSPPGWSDFQFGEQPQWFSCFLGWAGVEPNMTGRKTLPVFTDPSGKNTASVKIKKFVRHYPYNFQVAGTVTDVNRQEWTDKKSVLVHPGRLYVGVQQERRFVQEGEPIGLKYIVSDLDGKAISKRVKFQIDREVTTENDKGEWETKTVKVESQELESKDQPTSFEIANTKAGLYTVLASVTDEKGRQSDTKISIWVAGNEQSKLGGTKVEQGTVQVVPDKDSYGIADKARLLVLPPFYPCAGIITARNHGAIISTTPFKCDKSFSLVELPLDEQCVPSFKVQVDVIGRRSSLVPVSTESGTIKMEKRNLPAFAKGDAQLNVPPEHHKLSVSVTPVKSGIEPGGETDVDIDLKDNNSKPVEGQVAIAAVDESILALAGYQQLTPIDAFYATKDSMFGESSYLMSSLLVPAIVEPQDPESSRRRYRKGGRAPMPTPSPARAPIDAASLPAPSAMPPPPLPGSPEGPGGGAGGAGAADGKPIRMRSDFNPLALFKDVAQTDQNGHVRIKVKVADNLTRYRVMVWAVSGVDKAGIGDGNVTARLPLMVRPSLPRFLNCGDKAELPVVLQNQTDQAMEAEVAIRSNGLKLTEVPGGAVTVPANDRVEVRFPSETISAGTATIQLAAASGSFADAADSNLPVYTPATTEAFATYGQLDQGMAVQSIETPADALSEYGSLDVTTCSTALGGLEDAYFSLRRYQFDCSEQISARLLSMLALRDVLSAFGKQSQESAQETKAFMEADIKLLLTRQKYNGGFGLWKSDENNEWPYVSCQVSRALFLAKEKGFDVPSSNLDRCSGYLKRIEQYVPLRTNSTSLTAYSPKTRRAMLAYAQYVLSLNKQAQVSEARNLLSQTLKSMESATTSKNFVEWLSYSATTGTAETLAWLLPILTNDAASKELVESARKKVDACISETAAGAEVVSDSYDSDSYLIFHSPRRSSAVVLEALMQDQPDNPIIPKLVNHLMAAREKGAWVGTQENYYILCALDRYFEKYEKERPDFRVNMWIGSDFAGKQTFQGRSSDSNVLKIPMSFMKTRPAKEDLTIQKDGPGRLYYRIGMKYSPKNLMLDARDRGFGVDRKYIAVHDKDDVRVDKDGVIHVKAGATVKVSLTLNNAASRHHVALVDPIPAGFEITNPALQGSRDKPAKIAGEAEDKADKDGADKPFWFWWDRYWYDHHNFRDDRVEVFSSYIWGGNRQYSYFARATTPGMYVVPPTRAEEMYAPETFGRAASLRVIVE